jgi:multiple antibiotic resistance protein
MPLVMPRLLYAVLIFLVALNPVRVVPAFAAMTANSTPAERRRLAFRAVGAATVLVLLVAALGWVLRRVWQISWAIGLVLLLGALHTLFGRGPGKAVAAAGPLDNSAAFSPLAAPMILTPYAIAFVLLVFPAARTMDGPFQVGVIAALVGVMALNLVGLLAAGPIVRSVGYPALNILAWALAMMLAVLAVQMILGPLQDFIVSLIPGPDDDGDNLTRSGLQHAAVATMNA